MISGLSGPDRMAQRFPVESFPDFRLRMIESQRIQKLRRDARGTPDFETYRKQNNLVNKAARQDAVRWFGQHLMRRTWTEDGFRERIVTFWADHFTAQGKGGVVRRGTTPYVETAIRPNVTGKFEDLLMAVVQHPLMIHYLDQFASIGPNSRRGKKLVAKGKKVGLNENLAREVLELHTLGVGGPYTQQDVRQLAELFTGMTFQIPVGFNYQKSHAEPGPETVLGTSYGGAEGQLNDIRAVLRDLARHPATARHIAWKLAVHFVSDAPDPDLVASLAQTYRDTDGHLMELYKTLLHHPEAWATAQPNIKQPFDYISSAFRALAVPHGTLKDRKENEMRMLLLTPMQLMGQPWEAAPGPDGWPEEDASWITPQSVAARLQWAVAAPRAMGLPLPDPRKFVTVALGPRATKAVLFAANAAESKAEAIGLILASPAFQRL